MFKNKRLIVTFVILVLFTLLLYPSIPNIQALGGQKTTNSEEGLIKAAAATTYEEWNSSKIYLNGDMVTYNGKNYKYFTR